ncbi:MAG: histidine kinase [Rhodothermales bacterium]
MSWDYIDRFCPSLAHSFMMARLQALFADHDVQRALRVASHIVYWLAALGFFTLYFGRPGGQYRPSLVFASVLLPITIATTYVLVYVLIPRYLLERRYGWFALYVAYTLLLSFYLEIGVVVLLFLTFSEYQTLVVDPSLPGQLEVVAGMYVVVLLGVVLHLLKRRYAMQAQASQLSEARLEAQLKLKEAELALLRSQLHPHFLFNTLNTLYGLTLEQSERASEVVLRISEILDYMLYRADRPHVPLEDEVSHLRNYIALEQLRQGERLDGNFGIEGAMSGVRIAPLMLLPFVENSFKHGKGTEVAKGWIRIDLTVTDRQIRFRVANSKGHDLGPRNVSSGIGLENVRKRLKHVYPEAHELTLSSTPHCFEVELVIDKEPDHHLIHADR